MSNNDDDTATPVPRFRDAQVDRTVVHPNLSSSSSSLQTSQQHTFVVAADTQLGMTEQSRSWAREVEYSERAVQHINRIRPLYCCICGDLVESSAAFLAGHAKPNTTNDDDNGTVVWTTDECDVLHDAQNTEFQRIWSQLHPEIALVCLCGNHDVGNRPTRASIERFTSVYGDDYLAFWANGTYNIVLNSNLCNDPDQNDDDVMALYTEQLDWFQERLAYARSTPSCRLLFVFSHHPWFLYHEDETMDDLTGSSPYHMSWGPGSIPDSYFPIPLLYRRRVLDLCRQYHVDAAFSGHFHQNCVSTTSFGMEMIITGPLSVVLQSSANTSTTSDTQTQGFRLVHVRHDNDSSSFRHAFIPLQETER